MWKRNSILLATCLLISLASDAQLIRRTNLFMPLGSGGGASPPTLDAGSVWTNATDVGGLLSITHTNSGGANRVTYILWSADNGADCDPRCTNITSSVDVPLVSGAEVIGSATAQPVAIFRHINPASGINTYTVVTNAGSATIQNITIFTLDNNDQTTPADGVTTTSGSGTSLSRTVTSSSSGYVISASCINGNQTITIDAGETAFININYGGSGGAMFVDTRAPGAASVTVSRSWSGTQRGGLIGLNARGI